MEHDEILNQVFVQSMSVVFRRIGDEVLLVPIHARTADFESIYELNEVAARIWELLDGRRTGAGIRDALVSEYEVSPAVASADVAGLLQRLAAFGAVEPRS